MKSWARAARRRRLHLGVGRAEPAVADVVADRRREQQRLLRHDADLAAQRGQRDVADVDAVDGDPPGGDVVEPGEQVEHRRLAGAGLADERDLLAAAHHDVDAVERDRARPRGSSDAPSSRSSRWNGASVDGAGPLGDVGLGVEHLERPADADDRVLERPEHEHHLVHQLVDRLHVGDEDPQRPDRHGAVDDAARRHPQHDGGGDRR